MGKRLRKKTGGENRYAEKSKTPENAGDFATKSEVTEVKQGIDVLSGEIKTVGESVTALLESIKGSEKTPAQQQEMTEKQLADAQEINKRPNRAVPVFGEHTTKIGEDFLIKGITPLTPRDEAQKTFYTALKSPTDDGNMIEFQTRCDRMKMKCDLLKKAPHQLREFQGFQEFLEKTGFDNVVKVITTSTTSDFVPEGWSNEVQKYYYLALKVAALFNEFPMPQNPFRWDILGRPAAKRRAEPTASARGTNEVDAENPIQQVVTFDAEVLTVRVDLTEEFTEDAIDTYYDTLSREVIPEALAEGVESAIVNGDIRTTTNHQDDTGKAATDPETAWDGLRRHALLRSATVDVTADSGQFNYGRLTEVIGKGGKYLLSPADTAWVCDTSSYTKILNFSEVTTIDNFAMNATNVQGAVMMLMGRPLVVTEHLPLVNDSGVVSATAADNTRGTTLLVNRRQYRLGNIPRESVEMLWDPLTRFYYIVSTCRKDFQAMQAHEAGYTPACDDTQGITGINNGNRFRFCVSFVIRNQSLLGIGGRRCRP